MLGSGRRQGRIFGLRMGEWVRRSHAADFRPTLPLTGRVRQFTRRAGADRAVPARERPSPYTVRVVQRNTLRGELLLPRLGTSGWPGPAASALPLELLHRREDLPDGRLGVAEQEFRVVVVEERVVYPCEAGVHRALEHDHV